mgnify:CR=1 FL=1
MLASGTWLRTTKQTKPKPATSAASINILKRNQNTISKFYQPLAAKRTEPKMAHLHELRWSVRPGSWLAIKTPCNHFPLPRKYIPYLTAEGIWAIMYPIWLPREYEQSCTLFDCRGNMSNHIPDRKWEMSFSTCIKGLKTLKSLCG